MILEFLKIIKKYNYKRVSMIEMDCKIENENIIIILIVVFQFLYCYF